MKKLHMLLLLRVIGLIGIAVYPTFSQQYGRALDFSQHVLLGKQLPKFDSLLLVSGEPDPESQEKLPARGLRTESLDPSRSQWQLFHNQRPLEPDFLYLGGNGVWVHLMRVLGRDVPGFPDTLHERLSIETPPKAEWNESFFSWEGIYEWEADMMRKAMQSTAVFRLKIFELTGTGTEGRLEILAPDIRHIVACSLVTGLDTLEVYMSRYLGDNYGEPWQVGSKLFELIREPGGSTATHMGTLMVLEGLSHLNPESTALFQKVQADPFITHE